MPNANADDTKRFNGFTRSELNAFRVTSVLTGSFLMLIAWVFIPRVVAPRLVLPEAVWMSLGLLMLMLSTYPLLRMEARIARPPRVISWRRHLIGAVLGSVVSGLLFALLETVWPT